MKKFKFSLDPLLDLRKKQMENEQRELSIVVGRINKLKNEMNSNIKNINEYTERYSRKREVELTELRTLGLYIKGLYLQNENIQKGINTEQPALEEARKKLIEARKKEQILVIIKDKKLKEFQDKIRRLERTEEEEINQKIFETKRREDDEHTEDAKPKIPKRVKPVKKKVPQNEYEKLMEYAESFQKRK